MENRTPEGKEIVKVFGNREDIRDLAERIQLTSMIPGSGNYSQHEAYALAQICVAHGLDPFNGEVWLIKDKDGKVRGTMIGIKGLRKAAKRQLNGRQFWTRIRLLEGDERKTIVGDNKTTIVYRCDLTDEVTAGAYLILYSKSVAAGISKEDITKQLGEMPTTVGLGIYDPASESSKMKPHQVAMKRAEADAIKRRFDVPFGLEYSEAIDVMPIDIDQDQADDAGEGGPDIAVEDEPEKSEADLLKEMGYDTPADESSVEPSRPYVPEYVRSKIAERVAVHINEPLSNEARGIVISMLEYPFMDKPKDVREGIRHSITGYLIDRASLSEATGAEVKAFLDWLKPDRDSGGAYSISSAVVAEIVAVWNAAQVAAGQLELPV